MKQSIVMLVILIILLALIAYFASKAMKYKSEKEKNAIKKGFIAYLFTDSLLISWLVYRRDINKRL